VGATAALGGGSEVGEDELRLGGDAMRQRQGTPPPRSHAGCAPALVVATAAKARRPSRTAARGCGGGDGGVRGRGGGPAAAAAGAAAAGRAARAQGSQGEEGVEGEEAVSKLGFLISDGLCFLGC